jgi:hypothetical protein
MEWKMKMLILRVEVKLKMRKVEGVPTTNLSLSQRNSLKLGPTKSRVICKLEESSHRVSPRGEDEDEGGLEVRVEVGLGEVKGWGLDEFLPKARTHKGIYHRNELVGSEATDHHHLLEISQFLVPGGWEGLEMGLGIVIERVPIPKVSSEVLDEAWNRGITTNIDNLPSSKDLRIKVKYD